MMKKLRTDLILEDPIRLQDGERIPTVQRASSLPLLLHQDEKSLEIQAVNLTTRNKLRTYVIDLLPKVETLSYHSI